MKITGAKLFIKQDGEWQEVGAVRSVAFDSPKIESVSSDWIFLPLRSFEVECAFTWARWAPFALSLPPAGCVPMFN